MAQIKDIQVKNYRAFEDFSMSGLARVNLLVGKNNCGKTSLLEALQIFASGGHPRVLWDIGWERGELILKADSEAERAGPELDPGFFYRNHEIDSGSSFEISGNNGLDDTISFSIIEMDTSDDEEDLFEDDPNYEQTLSLSIKTKRLDRPLRLSLSHSNGIIMSPRRFKIIDLDEKAIPTTFIRTKSLDHEEMGNLWNSIALTPEEDEIVGALRILDPKVERIAFLSLDLRRFRSSRRGIVLKLKDSDVPMPLGSLGDGMHRLLALTLAVLQNENGILLVDEIDTGLHYTSMPDMWKLLLRVAERRNVQIFATTHSWDCVMGLAKVCETDTVLQDQVSMHRIESDATQSVVYSGEELITVAKEGIEPR